MVGTSNRNHSRTTTTSKVPGTSAVEPIARPFLPKGSTLITCERCGQQQATSRFNKFRDEDYLEYWHESQAEIAQWIEAYKKLQREYLRLGLKLWDAEFDAQCERVSADGYKTLYEAITKA